ncbi:DUF6520 family protein [Christiangramia sp. LLG6405-1]|uniref:DUF6520 family protein n=1 Tax=Christiangramia sp. LLG6405-1 TaxID=3160832 RepID=UPI00386D6982
MKKLFLIPVMALLVVFGMSFTNLESETEEQPEIVASDYIRNNGSWEAIPEQNCATGSETCRVQFGVGGPVFDVYDEMLLNTLKASDSPEPTILN